VFNFIHDTLSEICRDHLRQLRLKVGMTQRDLAKALNREHGMVARIELGERRVDLLEAYELFIALGANPEKEAAALMAKFAKADVSASRKRNCDVD
jgi:transcriptional regulator with XRE-family HTH domain